MVDKGVVQQASLEISGRPTGNPLEKGGPFVGVVQPALPLLIEGLFDLVIQPPNGDSAGQSEDLGASCFRGGKDRARLRKVMCAWKAPSENARSAGAQLPGRIPPARHVLFAMPSDN